MSIQPILVNADEVRDHWWWRPGWHVGQRMYTWHLTFDGQHQLHRLVRDYQAALTHLPQVDPIPTEWLHLTMQGVGFTADVTADNLTAVIAAVRLRPADLTPAALTFTRPVVLPEAVALPPEPAEPVHEIRGAIRAGIADVWGADKVPGPDDEYRAHLSLGYVNAAGPAAPIIQALESVEPHPASIIVPTASLIELHVTGACTSGGPSRRYRSAADRRRPAVLGLRLRQRVTSRAQYVSLGLTSPRCGTSRP